MMKNIVIIITVLLFSIAGCKTPVNVAAYRESAEEAAKTGDYIIATEQWKQYFMQLPPEETLGADVYAKAAQAAHQAADPEQAIEWFELAGQKGYNDPQMHLTLAEIYRNMGNVSNELASLEAYKSSSG